MRNEHVECEIEVGVPQAQEQCRNDLHEGQHDAQTTDLGRKVRKAEVNEKLSCFGDLNL